MTNEIEIEFQKRNDEEGIYKEIENFQDYEYTNCIAYEMAIRNNDVIEIKSRINNLIETMRKNVREKFDKFEQLEKMRKKDFDILLNSDDELKKEYTQYRKFFSCFLYHIDYDFLEKYSLETKEYNEIKELNQELINNYWIRSFFDDEIINAIYGVFFQKINNDYIEFEIKSLKFKEKSIHEINEFESSDYISSLPIGKYDDNSDIREVKEWKIGVINEKGMEVDLSKFYKTKNTLIVPKNLTKTIKININLNLPLEELKAYIEHIKLEYEKDNSIIKSTLELLGEKLNIKTIKFKEMTSKEWADCFFIYDYFKSSTDKLKGTKFQKLQEVLTKYNGVKIEKTKEELRKSKNRNDNSKYKIVSYKVYNELKDNYIHKKIKPFYSLATIEDRLKLMILLIDDLGYKTLIS